MWFALTQAKSTIIIEPESTAEFKAAKRRYEEAIDAPGGGRALLLAVYRGKMSEVIRCGLGVRVRHSGARKAFSPVVLPVDWRIPMAKTCPGVGVCFVFGSDESL